ncbi:MAG: hypothetical protein M0009_08220 [Deltaproteobacteria bacterium]|nr:hypothetical protein [Deltaproteobacteria bacterium]
MKIKMFWIIKVGLAITVTLFCTSCITTYTIPQNVISERITREQLSQKGQSYSLVGVIAGPLLGMLAYSMEYDPKSTSGLKWLPAMTENGEMVEVEITRVSTFIIKTKSSETVKMLATTAFISDGVLKGKRSSILGMAREVPVDDIAGIELYTENSQTRPLKNR